jgi:DNA-binding NtrC family response regulator
MALLLAYDYPGNVRELKNAVEHAAIMSTGESIGACDLPKSINHAPREAPAGSVSAGNTSPESRTLKQLRDVWLAPLEQRYLTQLLDQCDGNVRRAAEQAGINTVTMYRLLKKRGLKLRREVSE